MNANRKSTKAPWIDPDDAPELTEELAARAQIAVGGKVVRKPTGTLTKRGRPPIGDAPKQQVTLRLSRDVLGRFKAGGPGWQSRIDSALRRAVKEQAKRA